MEGNKKFLSCSLIILLLMGGSLLLFQGVDEASGYVEEMINPYDTIAAYPALDGMYMVYVSGVSEEQRVVLRDIITGKERKLVDFRSYAPDISGDHVVFLGRDGLEQDVYLYTISSSSWIKITNGPEIEMAPRISGENIVWYQDMRSHDLQILHYHPSTGIREISTYIDHDMYPNIHGNFVVWESMKPGYSMIMGYDLTAKKEIDVVNFTGIDCHKPDIYEDRIVYTAVSGPNELVWLYNASTKHYMYISNFNYRSDWPRIDRDNVVFLSDFDGRWDIGLYDIKRGAERRLTYDSSHEYYPVIWGEHVAFTRDRGGLQLFYILLDHDDDGMPDIKDMFPYNPNEIFDTDGDGLGDNIDPDADNDNYLDEVDAFPFDKLEWADFDGDGMGDNMDPDDDNDGIPDIDDPFPLSDINPIMDYLMELMQRLYDMEQNLTGRLYDLEQTLTDLLEENEAGIMEGINVALLDLNHTLEHLNLSDELDGILVNFSEIYEQEPDWYNPMDLVDSFFDVFSELVTELETNILENLQNITEDLDQTNQNVAELMEGLEALNEIEGIVTDLEQVSLDVQSQNDNLETSDNNLRTYFIVLIVVLAVYTVLMILFFMNVSRKKKVEDMDEY